MGFGQPGDILLLLAKGVGRCFAGIMKLCGGQIGSCGSICSRCYFQDTRQSITIGLGGGQTLCWTANKVLLSKRNILRPELVVIYTKSSPYNTMLLWREYIHRPRYSWFLLRSWWKSWRHHNQHIGLGTWLIGTLLYKVFHEKFEFESWLGHVYVRWMTPPDNLSCPFSSWA